MLLNLRHLLIVANALLVMAMGAPSVIGGHPDLAPAVHPAALVLIADAGQPATDASEEPGGLVHEQETHAEHALIALDALPAGPATSLSARIVRSAPGLSSDGATATLDRPPRMLAARA